MVFPTIFLSRAFVLDQNPKKKQNKAKTHSSNKAKHNRLQLSNGLAHLRAIVASKYPHASRILYNVLHVYVSHQFGGSMSRKAGNRQIGPAEQENRSGRIQLLSTTLSMHAHMFFLLYRGNNERKLVVMHRLYTIVRCFFTVCLSSSLIISTHPKPEIYAYNGKWKINLWDSFFLTDFQRYLGRLIPRY